MINIKSKNFVKKVMAKGYNGYLIKDKNKLFNFFPPKYQKVFGHHITHEFNVEEELPPKIYEAKIIGYADSEDGIEALVVSLNNEIDRPDGSIYHITLSLDPNKYKPKDSNTLLKKGYEKLVSPISIKIEPKFFPFNNKY